MAGGERQTYSRRCLTARDARAERAGPPCRPSGELL